MWQYSPIVFTVEGREGSHTHEVLPPHSAMGACGSKGGARELSGTPVALPSAGQGTARRTFAGAHDDMANSVACGCGPGEWLSCAEDKTVALTDWISGRVVSTWRGHSRGVNRVIPAPHVDGALSCSRDTTVRLWKRGEAEAVATLSGHELAVSAVALSEDGGRAFSGSRDSSLRLWDLATASLSNRVHVSRNVVTCLRWIDGEPNLVAQGSEDLRLRLWDVRTLQKPAATLEGYVYFPLCVDCADHLVLTGSNGFDGVGCELRLWDRRTLRQLHELNGHQQAVNGVALLRPSSSPSTPASASSSVTADAAAPLLAASGCKDGSVHLWDTASGGCVAKLPSDATEGVTGVAAARAGEVGAQLYVSTVSGSVHALALGPGGGGLRVVATGGAGVEEAV
jgi:WD40 repeat protein